MRRTRTTRRTLRLENLESRHLMAADLSGVGAHTNPENPLDADGSGAVDEDDALRVFNALEVHGAGPVAEDLDCRAAVDVTGDGVLSPEDALAVINFVNKTAPPESRPETATEEAPLEELTEELLASTEPGT